jgi:branched-chain amino acid transport system ATP-binding protein
MHESLLEITGLRKHFGALKVTDDLHLRVMPNEVHALIGPNGAGKTTLIHQIAGTLRSDAGTIALGGVDVTKLPASQRVRLGIARSYQVTNIFRSMRVIDNVALAVQARHGHSFSFWRAVRRDIVLRDEAANVLARLGLIDQAQRMAGSLSYGDQRLLEVGLALATSPRVLLLDEPMAGLGQHESSRMVEMIRGFALDTAVVLVEHDMDAVFRLSDRISVLVYGRVIATGTPQEIRCNQEVVQAYLGDEVGL